MAKHSRHYIERGFTLIELMIVVAIVGILAAVAYPSYSRYVIKANRAAAQSYLMELAQKEQLYFNDSRSYAANEGVLSITRPDRVDDNYTLNFTIDANPPPTFIITASPKSGSRQVGDGDLSIDNTGQKLHGGNAW